jgi:hypothetical protein
MASGPIPLPPIAIVAEVPAPVTFEVITGRRYLHALEAPDDGRDQVRGFRERARFSIDDASGLVQIESEYGTFSYYWPPAHRREDLFTFLASLDFYYFMGKAAKQPHRVLDLDRTIAGFRKEILMERRSLVIGPATARYRWDGLDRLDGEAPQSGDDFMRIWHDISDLADWLYGADVSYHEMDHGGARHFWDEVWATLIASPEYRRHMRPKAAAA